MTVAIRVATANEVPILNAIRTSVRENHMSLERMADYGITPEVIARVITTTGRGFIASVDGVDAGISIAEAEAGCIFAMFVLPDYEGMGLGRLLMAKAERFLFEAGCRDVWLEAGAVEGLRAHGFYAHLGWRHDGLMPDGQLRFVKSRDELVRGPAA
ncbi:GNAT family N-acetyltransferase [Kaistia geumhonensis]|uniref:GNAT superfamily N-acetyltransferase n=1 Tax=Kaistia geumhonensis TaxID=410839 RepID=A0ABU0M4Z4_9HYPH|nr:GNAT family N-acetyltransferase [Kaistia geumhonensis]MCX5478779.1 GNAT family N-acetyltransferase [Kaistia geumhonensis]MDQ0516002.1 GNAT superfamily N-acetyltransferase [Kaistia geumhonensis]